MGTLFLEITVIVCIASFLSIVFRFFKQPIILAYILAGILIAHLGIGQIENQEVLQTMGEFGITFLLFMLGLELKISELKSVGKIVFIIGVGQIVITFLVGFILSIVLGFSFISATYISAALTFSSTIITVKLLSDKKDLGSLYGKIAIGILLIQDFVAILALMILSGFAKHAQQLGAGHFLLVGLKGILLFAITIYLSKTVLPRLVHLVSSSSEVLFLFSIAWAFGMSAVVSSPVVGFSIEIGGFLAGISLAQSSENYQIFAKIRPLRDFFVTIFFVILGSQMVFTNLISILLPAVFFAGFVLVGDPLIVILIMSIMGFRRRTSFLSGLSVAHISEFSLILVFLGFRVGHISDQIVSLVTVVGVITFTISTYMIMNGNKLYQFFNPYLSHLERKHTKWEQTGDLGILKDHVVLVGASRAGQSILDVFKDDSFQDVVVLDFNPSVVERLREEGIRTLFGDVSDPDIQERIYLDTARLVISTVPDLEDNLILIESLKHASSHARIIVLAEDRNDARILYEKGADYVVIPHLSSGRHIAKFLQEGKFEFAQIREKERAYW